MTLDQRITGLAQLGDFIRSIEKNTLDSLTESARIENPWFTPASVEQSLKGIALFLDAKKLSSWVAPYNFSTKKKISVIMAGNIPLVGFHDLLCVLISGHIAQVKISSKDSKLITYLIDELLKMEPAFGDSVVLQTGQVKDFDAVIATGSDNTARHFEYYFRNRPHIIRKNRTSCAILTGDESPEEFQRLGDDIFMYYGLGCRNVSKLFVPSGYDFSMLLSSWDAHKEIVNHHKYANNYDYQKAILLVNQQPFLDNGFVLLQRNERLVSPLAVLYYEEYESNDFIAEQLRVNAQKIQCVVGNHDLAGVAFGKAQFPELWDYADGIDTLKFLSSIN